MKIIYKLSIVALVSLMGLGASAQELPVRFGVEAGLNLSNSSWDAGSLDKKARVGFQVGVTADYAITDEWYLQSGLSFTTKGAKVEGESNIGGDVITRGKLTVNQMYLQLPVYAAYKIEVMPGTRIVFNAGPYVAYGVGGKTKLSGSIPIINGGANIEDDINTFGGEGILNRFDFGLGAGVGVEFGHIVANIRYELGLVNIGQDNLDYKNRNAALTVGYKF